MWEALEDQSRGVSDTGVMLFQLRFGRRGVVGFVTFGPSLLAFSPCSAHTFADGLGLRVQLEMFQSTRTFVHTPCWPSG
jgi:hypothetical protein